MDEIKNEWSFVTRRIRNKPMFIHEDGSVCSSLFKDSQGVSVNKDHRRNIESIIADEERLHRLYCSETEEIEDPEKRLVAITSIDKTVCEENSVYVKDDPIPDINPHHCLLQKSETDIVLTRVQAKALARGARFIKRYAL